MRRALVVMMVVIIVSFVVTAMIGCATEEKDKPEKLSTERVDPKKPSRDKSSENITTITSHFGRLKCFEALYCDSLYSDSLKSAPEDQVKNALIDCEALIDWGTSEQKAYGYLMRGRLKLAGWVLSESKT